MVFNVILYSILLSVYSLIWITIDETLLFRSINYITASKCNLPSNRPSIFSFIGKFVCLIGMNVLLTIGRAFAGCFLEIELSGFPFSASYRTSAVLLNRILFFWTASRILWAGFLLLCGLLDLQVLKSQNLYFIVSFQLFVSICELLPCYSTISMNERKNIEIDPSKSKAFVALGSSTSYSALENLGKWPKSRWIKIN